IGRISSHAFDRLSQRKHLYIYIISRSAHLGEKVDSIALELHLTFWVLVWGLAATQAAGMGLMSISTRSWLYIGISGTCKEHDMKCISDTQQWVFMLALVFIMIGNSVRTAIDTLDFEEDASKQELRRTKNLEKVSMVIHAGLHDSDEEREVVNEVLKMFPMFFGVVMSVLISVRKGIFATEFLTTGEAPKTIGLLVFACIVEMSRLSIIRDQGLAKNLNEKINRTFYHFGLYFFLGLLDEDLDVIIQKFLNKDRPLDRNNLTIKVLSALVGIGVWGSMLLAYIVEALDTADTLS
ncbi:hypothetical protein M8C21_018936, partial [Ambrosia artemisiifolia]